MRQAKTAELMFIFSYAYFYRYLWIIHVPYCFRSELNVLNCFCSNLQLEIRTKGVSEINVPVYRALL